MLGERKDPSQRINSTPAQIPTSSNTLLTTLQDWNLDKGSQWQAGPPTDWDCLGVDVLGPLFKL